MAASRTHRDGLKGRPPPRACPTDFEVIFVEQGRIGCEAWYRARRTTITRWLEERGKARLIKLRADYVAHQRANGKWLTRSSRLVESRPQRQILRSKPVLDRRKVSFTLARHAAQFLRTVRNGGFVISITQNGDWWVGSKRLSAAQMVDLARSKGFESAVGTAADRAPVHANAIRQLGADPDARDTWDADWRKRWLHLNGNADYSLGRDWQTDDDEDIANLHGRGPGEVNNQ